MLLITAALALLVFVSCVHCPLCCHHSVNFPVLGPIKEYVIHELNKLSSSHTSVHTSCQGVELFSVLGVCFVAPHHNPPAHLPPPTPPLPPHPP